MHSEPTRARAGGHQLVLSLYSITEIAAPLNHSSSKTNVMRLLNEVERLPLVFFHADVEHLEIDEAMWLFQEIVGITCLATSASTLANWI